MLPEQPRSCHRIAPCYAQGWSPRYKAHMENWSIYTPLDHYGAWVHLVLCIGMRRDRLGQGARTDWVGVSWCWEEGLGNWGKRKTWEERQERRETRKESRKQPDKISKEKMDTDKGTDAHDFPQGSEMEEADFEQECQGGSQQHPWNMLISLSYAPFVATSLSCSI